MKYWKLKGCPRCGGDVLVYSILSEAGVAAKCLQCGCERKIAEKTLVAVEENK